MPLGCLNPIKDWAVFLLLPKNFIVRNYLTAGSVESYSFTAPLKIPRAIVLLAARKSKTEGTSIRIAINAVS